MCYTSFLAIQSSCKTSSNCQKINLTVININPEVKKHKCKKHENKNYQLLTIMRCALVRMHEGAALV